LIVANWDFAKTLQSNKMAFIGRETGFAKLLQTLFLLTCNNKECFINL